MAGVKGRSGGPRANSGGVRPGAGRKPAPKMHALAQIVVAQAAEAAAQGAGVSQPTPEAIPAVDDPLQWLLSAMKNPALDDKLRIDAAKALLPFMHSQKGEGGKKEEKLDAAKKAGKGRFAAAPAPLRMVK